jgi:hypothetical protein
MKTDKRVEKVWKTVHSDVRVPIMTAVLGVDT